MTEAKTKELIGLPDKELKSRLEELNSSLIKLTAQVATGTMPKNTSEIRDTKRSIAKILTVMRQRQLKEETPIKKKIKESKQA